MSDCSNSFQCVADHSTYYLIIIASINHLIKLIKYLHHYDLPILRMSAILSVVYATNTWTTKNKSILIISSIHKY